MPPPKLDVFEHKRLFAIPDDFVLLVGIVSGSVIMLATAPKSNSAICAIDAALADSRSSLCDIPAHLKDSHYSGSKKLGHGISYKYPHDFPNHYTKQQYLPDELKNKKYYEFGNNKTEQLAKAYWDEIKK